MKTKMQILLMFILAFVTSNMCDMFSHCYTIFEVIPARNSNEEAPHQAPRSP